MRTSGKTEKLKLKLYFAYGANMNVVNMAHRCPQARIVGKAFAINHDLRFSRVADIFPRENSVVPGAVWMITRQCEKALDRFEGFPRLYRKVMINVELPDSGEIVSAMAYVLTKFEEPSVPMVSYYDTIHQGYKDFRHDSKALRFLKQRAAA